MAPSITFETVDPQDLPAFKKRLQVAFTQVSREMFPEFTQVIPPESDIDESIEAPGADAFYLVCNGQRVGGAVVSGTGANRLLDFIFIDPQHQDKHLGLAAWNAIEKHYAEQGVSHWELVTPYHERRNIHFYVNKCGFAITEYFNAQHPDPDYPQEEGNNYPGSENGLFKFEKSVQI